MFPRLTASCIVAALAMAAAPIEAGVIAENGIDEQFSGTVAACGQSVHVPVGSSWNNISFSFGEYNTGVPLASSDATLYLLDQEYLGPASTLSSSTSGYIAATSSIQAFGGGQEWVFDAAVTLAPDTDYWFCMDRHTNETEPFMGVVSITRDTYDGGNFYYSTPSSADYVSDDDGDLAFQLNGTAVPEPATGLLLLIAATGIVALRRRFARFSPARN